MSNLEDKELECQVCGNKFVFSVGEQEFFQEKGLQNVPKTCPACREKKRRGEKIEIKESCSICGKEGIFRKKIHAEKILCQDCAKKIA